MSIKSFPQLSSLTANCTDDFLLASGFTNSVAIYDVQTGKELHEIQSAHAHFINISRFANNSPHIFATASFDHTCKVWDLRRPMRADSALQTLHTGGLNVMCSFSPDDRHLLCSGVDTRLSQFEIPSFNHVPKQFCIREPRHQSRYRRSAYFADGKRFITAATDESHARIMSTSGHSVGIIDFNGFMEGSTGTTPQQDVNSATSSNGRSESRSEYIQSLRTHHEDNNLFGVLMLTYGPDPSSAVGLVQLEPGRSSIKCPW
jgi:WD40 repeat protein